MSLCQALVWMQSTRPSKVSGLAPTVERIIITSISSGDSDGGCGGGGTVAQGGGMAAAAVAVNQNV